MSSTPSSFVFWAIKVGSTNSLYQCLPSMICWATSTDTLGGVYTLSMTYELQIAWKTDIKHVIDKAIL